MNRQAMSILIAFYMVCSGTSPLFAQQPMVDGLFTFVDSGQRMPLSNGSIIVFGDLDGDGDTDIYESINGPDRVWWNDGMGNFADSGKAVADGIGDANDLELTDLDGDNDLDLLIAKNDGNLILVNDGSANFADSGQTIAMASGFTDAIATGDLDSDGDMDAYFGNRDFSENPDEVWLNDGTGIFSNTQQLLGFETSANVVLGDVDSDNDLDAIVTTCGQFNRPEKVWLNDGTGNFSDSDQTLESLCTVALTVHDFDGDNNLDLLIGKAGSDRGSFALWENSGSGQFSKTDTFTTSGTLFAGDLDGDQDVDILTSDGSILLNNGQGEFTQSAQVIPSGANALHDLDGDSDLDLIVATTTERQIWFNVAPTGLVDASEPILTEVRLPFIYR